MSVRVAAEGVRLHQARHDAKICFPLDAKKMRLSTGTCITVFRIRALRWPALVVCFCLNYNVGAFVFAVVLLLRDVVV